MARTNYTQKTLKLLREWKFNYWSVEQYNGFSGKKTDLFNIIDYIAITNYSVIGIQCCGVDFRPHINKLTIDEKGNTENWLISPNRKLILVGWRKLQMKTTGKRQVFKPRIGLFWLDEKGEIQFEEKKCI